jgi:HTH-type transcriptional regulator, competence development regulator
VTEGNEEIMVRGREKFGAFIRRQREAREIGLREMANMIGVSPTYLSKVERDEFPPPTEDRVKAIAKIIQHDLDDLLALAGRVSSDLSEIIRQQPKEMASFLRAMKGRSAEDMAAISRRLQKTEKSAGSK